MRGNRQAGKLHGQPLGPIPAYAGEPRPMSSTPTASRAYPRVCGGTTRASPGWSPDGGLSPRMRGNLGSNQGCRAAPGPIPAYAGEPARCEPHAVLPRAYPRVCGGTFVTTLNHWPGNGLSPRMRGNLLRQGSFAGPAGPIPAYAGEPCTARGGRPVVWAYPRVCGGTCAGVGKGPTPVGLSPRMRGNLADTFLSGVVTGPIPAYAGEPDGHAPASRPLRAYPRVCGGTNDVGRGRGADGGLSPRMRGNQTTPNTPVYRKGPIPAYAGEPLTRAERGADTRAYPRVCGGTDNVVHDVRCDQGLSPRMRGNRQHQDKAAQIHGPIPAYAGEPAWAHPPRYSNRAYPRVCGGTCFV